MDTDYNLMLKMPDTIKFNAKYGYIKIKSASMMLSKCSLKQSNGTKTMVLANITS